MNGWIRSALAAALIVAGVQPALAQVNGGAGATGATTAGSSSAATVPLAAGTTAGAGAFGIGAPIVVGAIGAAFVAAVAIAVTSHNSSTTKTTGSH